MLKVHLPERVWNEPRPNRGLRTRTGCRAESQTDSGDRENSAEPASAAGYACRLPSNHGSDRAVKHDIAKRQEHRSVEIIGLPQGPNRGNARQDIDDEDEERCVVSSSDNELTSGSYSTRERTHVHSPGCSVDGSLSS